MTSNMFKSKKHIHTLIASNVSEKISVCTACNKGANGTRFACQECKFVMCEECVRNESGPSYGGEDITETTSAPASQSTSGKLSELLPKSGLVYSERPQLSGILCKPKIMPLKSITLQKIERMEKEALAAFSRQSE